MGRPLTAISVSPSAGCLSPDPDCSPVRPGDCSALGFRLDRRNRVPVEHTSSTCPAYHYVSSIGVWLHDSIPSESGPDCPGTHATRTHSEHCCASRSASGGCTEDYGSATASTGLESAFERRRRELMTGLLVTV